jgi:hypothetical protein
LVGISEIHDRIAVNVTLKGAEEFRIDAEEVKKIFLGMLKTSDIATTASSSRLPILKTSITGETTGGGGAKFAVEVNIVLSIPSPFAENRSIDVILWRGSRSREEIMRYDPIAKDFVKPTVPIRDRVYEVVRELASQLAADFKKAKEWK